MKKIIQVAALLQAVAFNFDGRFDNVSVYHCIMGFGPSSGNTCLQFKIMSGTNHSGF